MDVRKIMIIRHAEKPPEAGPPHGVDLAGNQSPDQLIPLGWQRAGALVALFAPRNGASRPPIERPAAVFAAGISGASASLRPQSTVGPTALALGTAVQVLPAPSEEPAAAEAILESGSAVALVCWEHKHIKDLVAALTDGQQQSPHWHKSRFDMVFVLTRAGDEWTFDEVSQMLLSDDMTDTVSVPNPNA